MLEELYDRLISDVACIGLNLDFELVLRPYSKNYYGTYNPNNNRIVLYVYKDAKKQKLYPYWTILSSFIHEIIHYLQWHDENFVRNKGVMHDPQFYRLFHQYTDRMKAVLLLREVIQGEKDYGKKIHSVAR